MNVHIPKSSSKVFSKTCITDEISNARHFMILSSLNFTYSVDLCKFVVLKDSDSISPARRYALLSMKDNFGETYQSRQ